MFYILVPVASTPIEEYTRSIITLLKRVNI